MTDQLTRVADAITEAGNSCAVAREEAVMRVMQPASDRCRLGEVSDG